MRLPCGNRFDVGDRKVYNCATDRRAWSLGSAGGREAADTHP